MEIDKQNPLQVKDSLLIDALKKCTEYSNTVEQNIGLVKGRCGLILCWLFYYFRTKEQKYLNIAVYILNAQLLYWKSDFTLGSGMAGYVWVTCIMKKMKCAPANIDELLSKIEPLMRTECILMIKNNNFDYFSGSSGLIFYYLSKENFSNDDKSIITMYIDALANNQEMESSFYYKNEGKENQLILNLGVPHGITGIILILLLIKEKNQPDFKIDSLIHHFIEVLLRNVMDKSSHFYFPSYVVEKDRSYSPSILAWCYGDLTSCYAIFKAGKLLDNSTYLNFGLNALIKTTYRNDIHADSFSLCHGFASLICVYNELFAMTGNVRFRDTSNKWKNKAFSLFKKEYKTNNLNLNNSKSFIEDSSLFIGFPGFFLPLFFSKDRMLNEWQKCLLL